MNPEERPQVDGLGRVVVVIPTYNEADNLEWIVARMRAAQPSVDLLVVDDGSPDGTGDIADRLAAADPAVHVLHRTAKAGLGAVAVTPEIYNREFVKGGFTNPDAATRRSAIDLVSRAAELATDLGCDYVKLWPGQDGVEAIAPR